MIQNKHVIRLSFVGLFINIIANIIMYRYFMIEQIVMKVTEEHHTYVAEKYKETILDSYPDVLDLVNSTKYTKYVTHPRFIDFAKESLSFFEGIRLAQAVFYDKYAQDFLSTTANRISDKPEEELNFVEQSVKRMDEYFLQTISKRNDIDMAYQGTTYHSIVPHAQIFKASEMVQNDRSMILSYLPLIDSNFHVVGVLEVASDVTQQWDNITLLERRVFTSFVVVFGIFFGIILFNTHHAQKIIDQQFQSNKELDEARQKAEDESKSKTEFLANVSHELRTPLNAIIGFSEIMVSESNGPIENEQYKEYVNDINNSGKHLLSVINDILDFSKASADKLKVDNIEVDLNKVISSSMRFVKPRADEAQVQLIEELPKEHLVIKADPKRLKQAFLNLLSNSVKFTPPGGTVSVTINKDPESNKVIVTVSDTGIGMEEKDIPKALASFGQVDSKLSRKYDGTGLGLPLTKKLVELMEGTFELTSSPGKGTTVIMTFDSEEFELL